MAPQTWMVPRQKYDVIHYIRETYLKPHNPSQYATVDRRLPRPAPEGNDARPRAVGDRAVGRDGLRPEPDDHVSRSAATGPNIAYKGIAVRLDPGRGASPGAAPGRSSTTTRCASRPPGPATASSTGTASTSTASTRSIPGSSARVACRQPRRPRLGQPEDRTLRRSRVRRARRPALRPAAARLGTLPGALPPRRPA